MKTYSVTIKGVSPLLMHRFGEAAQQSVSKGTSDLVSRPEPEEQAENAAYRLPATEEFPKGELYTPAEHIRGAILHGAGLKKIGRRSAAGFVGGGIFLSPEAIGHNTETYQIDSRPVVIRSTRGRVMRHRPKLENWELSFDMEVDDSIFKEPLIKEILDLAGSRAGIGDYRPQRRGPFGRFIVTHFEEVGA